MRRLVAGVLLASLAGCVQVTYERSRTDEPFDAALLETLRAGQDSLTSCLQTLGAPRAVFEYRVEADGSSGMALLWVAKDADGWGIDVSAQSEDVPGSIEFDLGVADLQGCMLWFTRDLVLEQWRTGGVGELVRMRARPSYPVE